MNKRIPRLSLLSIVLFLCVGQTHAQVPAHVCDGTPIADLSGRLPVPDFLDAYRDCHFRLPSVEAEPSAWLATDAKQYSELLSRTKSAWLVLPAQTQYYGFDRIERALIGAEVADAFSDQGSMPDTFLVARALGEVRRRYEVPAIELLTDAVGANRRVTIFAGHDSRKHMTLTILLEDCTGQYGCKLIKQHDWRAIAFSDELPPFRVVHGLQSEIRREFLGNSPPLKPAKPAKAATASIIVPPAKFAQPDFVADARTLSLLAALAPEMSELAGRRLSSGALRAWLKMPVNAESRFFSAYAAMALERRPYAVALLGDARDPAANALRQLLDGNLPEAQENIAAVQVPLQRLLLAFGLQELLHFYGREAEFDASLTDKAFGISADAWRPLVERRAGNLDAWSRGEPEDIKLLLDALAPVEALSLRNIVVGGAVVGDHNADVTIANFRHLRRALAGFNGTTCCFATGRGSAAWPMYWLLEGLAESDVLKEISLRISKQGLPEQALSITEAFDPYLGGQPDFEAWRSYILSEQLRHARNEDARRYNDRSEKAEEQAAYWSQGQSRTSLGLVFRSTSMTSLAAAYTRDFPTRGYWLGPTDRVAPGQDRDDCAPLKYSTHDIGAAMSCLSALAPAARAQVLPLLQKRFHGNPDGERLAALFPAQSPQPSPVLSGNTAKVSRLQAAIKADPGFWDNYGELGDLLVRDGAYAEAQRVYQSYPGLKGKLVDNRVALSNYTYEAGSELYWRGETQLARPLYEFAAKLDTGSSASITSSARLAQLDGDYETAAMAFFERATRYADPYAFRDYLSLLHVMGHAEEARSGFLQIADRFETPQVWTAPLVDQRMGSMSYGQMKVWVLKEDIRTSRYRGRRFAPYFATMWAMTDRTPPADFPQLMEQIERDAARELDSGYVSRPYPTELGLEYVAASPFGQGKVAKPANGTRVKSEYVLLAEALTATHARQYESAVEKFIALANLYPIERDATQVAMAYFALAAAKTGDKYGLEKYIESLGSSGLDFDVGLSRAFFAAVKRRPDEAAAALKSAFNNRPHTELRPVPTEYQYAEACEIVATETGDPRFTEMLLAWARQHQQLQPTQAWAYAIEAQYSKVPVQANRALALTLYLDPASPRIAKIDKQRRDSARAWLKANNPFVREAVKPEERVTFAQPSRAASAP